MNHQVAFQETVLHPIRTALKYGTEAIYSDVLHDPFSYLKRTPRHKIVKKFLHKYWFLRLTGQLQLLRNKIDRKSRILLLYTGKDSFGDSNLELSGRSLLRGLGISIDLLTLPKLMPQFREDDIFCRIFTDLKDVNISDYNAILLAEFNHRSLRLKARHFPDLPFACLFGYFDGPARNQCHFSHAAFNDIFSIGLTKERLLSAAKPYLSCSTETERSAADLCPSEPFVCLSVGGIDPYRTYRRWSEVLQLMDGELERHGIRDVVLVGSDNGKEMARQLKQLQLDSIRITDRVASLSLLQSRCVIARASLFMGCDGGLMHVAHSTQAPSVALFSAKEPQQYWTTEACHCSGIQSTGAVSEIDPEQIVDAFVSTVTTITKSHAQPQSKPSNSPSNRDSR